jgi:hypothetical protein
MSPANIHNQHVHNDPPQFETYLVNLCFMLWASIVLLFRCRLTGLC